MEKPRIFANAKGKVGVSVSMAIGLTVLLLAYYVDAGLSGKCDEIGADRVEEARLTVGQPNVIMGREAVTIAKSSYQARETTTAINHRLQFSEAAEPGLPPSVREILRTLKRNRSIPIALGMIFLAECLFRLRRRRQNIRLAKDGRKELNRLPQQILPLPIHKTKPILDYARYAILSTAVLLAMGLRLRPPLSVTTEDLDLLSQALLLGGCFLALLLVLWSALKTTSVCFVERYPEGDIKRRYTVKPARHRIDELVFYKSGKLNKSQTYFEGHKEGKARTFYPGGKVYIEAYYRKGRLTGEYTVFEQSGKIRKVMLLDDGSLRRFND